MQDPANEEIRRLALTSGVCAAIGAALVAVLIFLAPPLSFRLFIIAAVLLGITNAKVASNVATFSGYILLIPIAFTPLAMLIGLAIASGGLPSGDNPVWFVLGVPMLAYFGAAAVTIKMDT